MAVLGCNERTMGCVHPPPVERLPKVPFFSRHEPFNRTSLKESWKRGLWNISIAMRRVLWAAHRNDIEKMRSARVQAHVSTSC
jgi:hypothetical protein